MSTTSEQIIAAQADRIDLVIYNPRSVDLLINLGATASASAAVARIGTRQTWTMGKELAAVYTGAIHGILGDAGDDGAIYVQELTI